MEQEKIVIRGLRQNNLKNVSLDITKGKIVVFTGVSGSGKSSIVFDTIGTESQRQMNGTYAGKKSRTMTNMYSSPPAAAPSCRIVSTIC